MSSGENCDLLLHNSLLDACGEVMTTSRAGSLTSKLQQIKGSPGNGPWLQGTEITSELKGRLYKVYIGGGGKFRLFYYFDPTVRVVLVFHFTTETRGNINYEDITPIVEDALAVVADFIENGSDNFFTPTF